MLTASKASHGFSMIELLLVIFIMGVIVAIATPRFADAGSGRRLHAAQQAIEKDIETAKLRARATGLVHTIVFYPSENMYVVFEGTDIKREAIVLSRDLNYQPLAVELSRTNIGGDQTILVSRLGDLEKDFTIAVRDDGIERTISFTGVGFTPEVVTESDTIVEIKTEIIDIGVGGGGIRLNLGL